MVTLAGRQINWPGRETAVLTHFAPLSDPILSDHVLRAMHTVRSGLVSWVALAALGLLTSGCAVVDGPASALREPFSELGETLRPASGQSRLFGVSAESRKIERHLGIR